MAVTSALDLVLLTSPSKSGVGLWLADTNIFFFAGKLVALSTEHEVLVRDDVSLGGMATRVLTLWHLGQPSRKVDPFTFAAALVDGLTRSTETLRTEILAHAHR